LNKHGGPYRIVDIFAICHEWQHVLIEEIWQTGEYNWIQCSGLHDQIRPRMLQAAWMAGERVEQPGIFVKVMQRYITEQMWLKCLKRNIQINSESHDLPSRFRRNQETQPREFNCYLMFRICSLWMSFFSSYVLVFLI
jgi:hypothetical protein